MPGGKPTTNAPDMPQGQGPRDSGAASNAAATSRSPVPDDNDPGSERADVTSPPGNGQPQLHKVQRSDPAGEPAVARGSRFGKLPDWALLPREVAIGLAAVVAAGVIILLVLSGQ